MPLIHVFMYQCIRESRWLNIGVYMCPDWCWQPDIALFGLCKCCGDLGKNLTLWLSKGFLFPPATGLFPLVCSITMVLRKLRSLKWFMLDCIWPFFRLGPERKWLSLPSTLNTLQASRADQDFLRHLILTKCQCAQKTSWQVQINNVFKTYKSIYQHIKHNVVHFCDTLKPRFSPSILSLAITLFFWSCHGGTRYSLIPTAFFPFCWRGAWQRRQSITQTVRPSLSLLLTVFLFLLPLG